jgi:DNA-binding response OmpR family regulator
MKMKTTVLALMMAVTPQTRATIHRALRPDDFDIVWSTTPSEAIQLSTRHHPSLVLLDLDQPLYKGWIVLKDLRTLNPSVPVVVLADHASSHDKGTADNGIAVLKKPLCPTVLADAANSLLTGGATSALPVAWKEAEFWDQAVDAERFREMLLERHNTPFAFASVYHHWGINE